MEFYRIITAGDLNDQDLCLVEGYPDGMGIKGSRLALGKPATDVYPDGATFQLRKENKGLKLLGLLGNLDNNLMLNTQATDLVREHMEGEDVEYFPFTLLDHKGRVHSDDYWIVNPLGSLDCLHQGKSVIRRNAKNKVIDIRKYVLDKAKIGDAPALFRIRERVTQYVMNENLVEAFRRAEIKNLYGYKLEQA